MSSQGRTRVHSGLDTTFALQKVVSTVVMIQYRTGEEGAQRVPSTAILCSYFTISPLTSLNLDWSNLLQDCTIRHACPSLCSFTPETRSGLRPGCPLLSALISFWYCRHAAFCGACVSLDLGYNLTLMFQRNKLISFVSIIN